MATGKENTSGLQAGSTQPTQDIRQILLIDDELHFCNLAADILATSICRLSFFTDSHEGLREALTHKSFDLILLDIDMPSPNGIEILTQLKKSHLRHVPVMMFTAHAEMDLVHQALDLGAQEYLLKPFTVNDFVAHLNHVLKTDIFQGHFQPDSSFRPADASPEPEVQKLILMVDDDERQLKLIQDMLEDSACQVITTTSAKEALALVGDLDPGLILLDLHMPEMDGFEFLQALRSQGSQVPVIVLTGDNSEASLAAASQHQLAGYLLKPYRFHELINKIEKSLQIKLFPEHM